MHFFKCFYDDKFEKEQQHKKMDFYAFNTWDTEQMFQKYNF